MDQPCPEVVDVLTRIDRLERRIDMLNRTLAVLIDAAVEDECAGATGEELHQAQAAGDRAMVAAVNEFRAAS